MRRLTAQDYRVMPWKNGGGTTTEIAVFPAGASLEAFAWRVSMAHVASDGPFSLFPGVDRTLCVVGGRGIALAVAGRTEVVLTPDSPPYSFPADAPTMARLMGGAIDDLNVMTRRGLWRHSVERLFAPATVDSKADTMILFARTDGVEIRRCGEIVRLGAAESLVFEPSDGVPVQIETTAARLLLIRLIHIG